MKILGIKYTHDASVALVEDGRLRFSIELEKTGVPCARHPKMPHRSWIDDVLAREKLSAADIDAFVVDGWNLKRQRFVAAAGYNEFDGGVTVDPLTRTEFPAAQLTGKHVAPYTSYTHATTHLLGIYALSPFAPAAEDAVLITWDGGHSARAYMLQPRQSHLVFLGVLVDLCASVYTHMGLYFGPYKRPAVIEAPEIPFRAFGQVEWPGKLMAWLAHGQPRPELRSKVAAALDALPPAGLAVSDDADREHTFLRALRGFDDADVLATVHAVLGDRFVQRAMELCPRLPVVLSGGAALNIKWNSALRRCGHFPAVWAPPVANDSGSAIGAAFCEYRHRTGRWHLDWNVYSGPALRTGALTGWTARPTSAEDIGGRLVRQPEEPVILLRGRAEIGPRALGHRSIIASAVRPENKDLLNRIKRREAFRPVAPICLESEAAKVFDPGWHDPFMVFEQTVRREWKSRIPAVVHLDGTARVQTVSVAQEPFLATLLGAYHAATGVPVLCNTSANRSGAGFFESIADTAAWAAEVGINAIVAENMLYERNA